MEKGASSWLSAMPIKAIIGYALNQGSANFCYDGPNHPFSHKGYIHIFVGQILNLCCIQLLVACNAMLMSQTVWWQK